MSSLKEVASSSIDNSKDDLRQLSNEIWMHPELGYEEYKAHDLLTNFLEKKGFTVERSFTGIKTAFRATFGSGRPNVCVICEYDALPEIGHACGHNLIAEAGIAAGLGLKAVLETPNAPKGMVTVMGTPAEETEGAKVKLIANGSFKDIDIAMMVHPSPETIVVPLMLAVKTLNITYTGKAAHAAAFPWEGVNALDAAVMAYTSISVLRQQMKPTWRVHGITLAGGEDPAIIPNKTCLRYYIRTQHETELAELEKKLVACFEAAASATGCTVGIKDGSPCFDNMVSNVPLAKHYAMNLEDLGCQYVNSKELTISTDMGNVSHSLPSIHPMYVIGSGKEFNHTTEFAQVAKSPKAHSETLVAAKAMAHTCIDVLTTDGLLEQIKKCFV